jgi:hypothetical protein
MWIRVVVLFAIPVLGPAVLGCESTTDPGGSDSGDHTEIVGRFVEIVAADPGLEERIRELLPQQREGAFWHGKDLQFL